MRISDWSSDVCSSDLATARGSCRSEGTPASVQARLVEVLADPAITLAPAGELGTSSTPPQLTAAILDPIRAVAADIWPGVAIVPTMTTGATDGRYLNTPGIPTYGVSGMFHHAEGSHAHGLEIGSTSGRERVCQ